MDLCKLSENVLLSRHCADFLRFVLSFAIRITTEYRDRDPDNRKDPAARISLCSEYTLCCVQNVRDGERGSKIICFCGGSVVFDTKHRQIVGLFFVLNEVIQSLPYVFQDLLRCSLRF